MRPVIILLLACSVMSFTDFQANIVSKIGDEFIAESKLSLYTFGDFPEVPKDTKIKLIIAFFDSTEEFQEQAIGYLERNEHFIKEIIADRKKFGMESKELEFDRSERMDQYIAHLKTNKAIDSEVSVYDNVDQMYNKLSEWGKQGATVITRIVLKE